MAYTSFHPIKKTLCKAINYIKNPVKTEYGLLVSAYACGVETADLDFQTTAFMAKDMWGNHTNIGGSENIAYHMIQSFAPWDNVTPEQAHQIGKKLADEFLGGKFEYIISTHVDKGHIHNHIIFNATSIEDFKKFRTVKYKTAREIEKVSNKICFENGLSVIDKSKSKNRGKSYKEWSERKKGSSWKLKLEKIIDSVILNAHDYNEFVILLNKSGVTIKEGKYITFKLNDIGMERFVRGKTIGENYTKENIIRRIDEENKINNKNIIEIDKVKESKIIEIKFNKKMIFEDNVNYIILKIPYKNNYIKCGKEIINWIDNDTIKIRLKQDEIYTIYNKNSEIKDAILGADIKHHFDYLETLKHKNIKLNGNLKNAQKRIMSVDKKAYYIARKENIQDIKQIAESLILLKKENINKLSDFELKIEELKNINKGMNEVINKIKGKVLTFNEVSKLLITYNKNLNTYQNYKNRNIVGKDNFYKKYESELRIFEYASSKLDEKGINKDINVDKLIVKIKEHDKELKHLQTDYKDINKRIDDILLAKEVITDIINLKSKFEINSEKNKRKYKLKQEHDR